MINLVFKINKINNHLNYHVCQVDPMDDRANTAFAALPERIYVVLDGRIAYQGGLGPFDYKIEEVAEFLSKRK